MLSLSKIQPVPSRTYPWAALWSSSLDGKSIPQVALLAYANRSSAISLIVTSPAFGPRMSPII
jgi:hypothetical protein